MAKSMILATRRHPLVVAFLGVCVLSGALGSVLPEYGSRTIYMLMPGYALVWNVLLALGGAVALAGVLHHKGILVERAGMWVLGGLFLAYGVGICIIDDAFFSTATGTILGLGVGCTWRAVQISRDVKQRVRDIVNGSDK